MDQKGEESSNRKIHLQPRALAADLLCADCREVLVEGVDCSAALDELHHTSDVAIGPDDHNTAVLLAKAHLGVGCCLRLGHAHVEDVVSVHVVVVAREHFGQQLFDLDVGPVGVVDCGEGEEVRVRVVFFQVVDGGDVLALVGGEEGVFLEQVGGEVADRGLGALWLAAEDVDAVRAVERDLLLEVYGVGI